ncbi:ABC transporter permease [bacterium]|nr:ABC transporter permease [bacterium]
MSPEATESTEEHTSKSEALAPGSAGQASANGGDLPETVISPDPRVRILQTIKDVIEYRELFLAFVLRDIKVRYKQTALGIVWVVLQPIITGGVFAIVISILRGGGDVDLSDLLFYMVGMVPWTSFASSLQMASTSMEMNANLVSKVYFPRMVVPGGHVVGSLLDFSIAFTVFLLLSGIAGAFTPLYLAMMPLLLLIQLLTAWGLGLFLASLNAQYRDVKYAIPFILQIGMFLVVPLSLYQWQPWWLQELLTWNPMSAVVEGYRNLLVGRGIDWALTLKGLIGGWVLLALGIKFFTSRERMMVDIL